MSETRKPKGKKILFSETIDGAINGFALGFSFLAIGTFLLLNPTYFFKPIVSYIFGAIIGIIGVLGTGIELSKSLKIKGMDNLSIGIVLLLVWLIAYLKVSALWANIVFFFFLILGSYGVCLGLMQGIYSIISNIQLNRENNESRQTKGKIISQIVLFLTQLCSLVIAVFNLIKAIYT